MLVSSIRAGRGGTAVELDTVALEHAEDGRAALEPADLPDIVDDVAGLVHVHDHLLPVLPEGGLGLVLPLALQVPDDAPLAPADLGSLLGDPADRIEDVTGRGLGEELVLRVDPVVDGHDPDLVDPAQVQERTQLADAPDGVAQPGEDDLVFLLQEGEELAPLGAQPLLDTFLYDDAVASEFLHPSYVLLTGMVALREEQVSGLCHNDWGIVLSKIQTFPDNSNGTRGISGSMSST